MPPEADPSDPAGDAAGARARKIIHVDMDAFYASVEQRDDPSLRGRPVAVGGSRERGVVAAASYEARVFGVRSAMASVTARRRCPDLVFVKPRFEMYRAISLEIRAIFAEYTPFIEPLSLDEAYLDVTDNLRGEPSATRIAAELRERIRAATGLTASAGVSYNKFLAKLASDHRKPDGLFVIPPERGAAFVETLPVGRFHGIGPATSRRMNRLGIFTGLDLRGRSLAELSAAFGKAGPFYYAISRGLDGRPVRADRERRSVGAETTFPADLSGLDELRDVLLRLADKVWRAGESARFGARTVTLKVKFSDFRQITRSRTERAPITNRTALEGAALALLGDNHPFDRPVRLIGVSLSGFGAEPDEAAPAQLPLGL